MKRVSFRLISKQISGSYARTAQEIQCHFEMTVAETIYNIDMPSISISI